MKKGQSYLSASRQYYQELRSGKTNRAKEFLDKMGGLDTIQSDLPIK